MTSNCWVRSNLIDTVSVWCYRNKIKKLNNLLRSSESRQEKSRKDASHAYFVGIAGGGLAGISAMLDARLEFSGCGYRGSSERILLFEGGEVVDGWWNK